MVPLPEAGLPEGPVYYAPAGNRRVGKTAIRPQAVVRIDDFFRVSVGVQSI